ncbi:MAG: hypothetical protein OXH95_01600, partial [bacterium]|nr:hypothetical protein [bacterium]
HNSHSPKLTTLRKTRNGSIWAGWTRATTGVNVRDDHIRERDETLVIELTEAEGAVIADNATATGTIIDND